jgi:hypothetical protein
VRLALAALIGQPRQSLKIQEKKDRSSAIWGLSASIWGIS